MSIQYLNAHKALFHICGMKGPVAVCYGTSDIQCGTQPLMFHNNMGIFRTLHTAVVPVDILTNVKCGFVREGRVLQLVIISSGYISLTLIIQSCGKFKLYMSFVVFTMVKILICGVLCHNIRIFIGGYQHIGRLLSLIWRLNVPSKYW
jgi:hypothetical protein